MYRAFCALLFSVRGIVLLSQAVLQASVPELIYRSYCAEDASFTGVIEKSHQPHGRMPSQGKLGSGE